MATPALDLWWWGEDEAPGLGEWVAAQIARFEAPVRTRLLCHDEVLPAFPAAAAAGTAPDVHFFWNGIYVVDHVWRGHVRPLDDLIDPVELAAIGGGPLSVVGDKSYRVGWYVIPVFWVANLDVLARSGVERPPASWSELEEACERVRRAGYLPLTCGDGEGDFSVWWLTHLLTQQLDVETDVARLVLGELDWREPRYAGVWAALARFHRNGWLDEAALPLTLWAGLARFNEGRSAFTLASGPMFAACRSALGAGAAAFVAPRTSRRALAGVPIVDTQGLGISAQSRYAELAARLLVQFHDESARASLWRDVRQLPADPRFDAAEIDDDAYRSMWEWFRHGPSARYVPDLIPLELHYSISAGIGREVLRGAVDAGAEARRRAREWVRTDAARAERYRAWIDELRSCTPSPRGEPRRGLAPGPP